MRIFKTDRGFQVLLHPMYPERPGADGVRLVQESSAVGDYPDSFDRPGSSFLWVGEHHHLNREEVASLAAHLRRWLDTGRLGEAEGGRDA